MTPGVAAPVVALGSAALVNLCASLLLLFPLREGTLAGGAVHDRMSFIAEHRTAWSLGWTGWMAATITLLGFFWALHELCPPEARGLGRLALLLAAPGAAADLLHDVVQAALIAPAASQGISPERFLVVESLAVILGGGVVNLMYGLAGFAITAALARSRAPRWLVIQSACTWMATLALALGGFLRSPALLVTATAATMSQFVALALTLALRVARRGGLG